MFEFTVSLEEILCTLVTWKCKTLLEQFIKQFGYPGLEAIYKTVFLEIIWYLSCVRLKVSWQIFPG